ncbi:MAG: transcription elongation factor GreA [Hyphomicrobium sp.]|nr:transcription elongation factor GreA [Hyphomicrobium sp.]
MSRAFVKDDDGGEGVDDLPDRPISPHPNLVTPEGLAGIEAELRRLGAAYAEAQQAGDRLLLMRTARDLRYWTERRATAELVVPQYGRESIAFGATVTLERPDGRVVTWRIVGEDEADPSRGTISYVSPLARALAGKSVGDRVAVAGGDAEIVAID